MSSILGPAVPLPLLLPPLVVDLDGTLTPSDTLVESFFRAFRRDPLVIFLVVGWLLRGRAVLKQALAARAGLDLSLLPLREDLVAYLRVEHARGRKLHLATAADQSIADGMAERLGFFDEVIASDGRSNVKGAEKLEAIQQRVGSAFAYAGDSTADLPIWRAAASAVLVNTSGHVSRQVRASGASVEVHFERQQAGLDVWVRAMRLHQWIKNVLVFLPLLTSFSFVRPAQVLSSLGGFLAFGLMASATYIANDLWDLDSDRAHARKRFRPLAAGAVSLGQAAAVAILLASASMVLAELLAPRLALLLGVYLVTTTAYSWRIKRHVVADCVTLALLYALRVLAGAVVIHVDVTPWLLAFCVFCFFGLAVLKRCSELVLLERDGLQQARGRDYNVADLAVLWPLGVGASLSAVVVFGLFVGRMAETSRFHQIELLWAVGIGLLYWFARLWIKTVRGEMHDDPIVFTLKDRGTRTLMVGMVLVTIAAYFL